MGLCGVYASVFRVCVGERVCVCSMYVCVWGGGRKGGSVCVCLEQCVCACVSACVLLHVQLIIIPLPSGCVVTVIELLAGLLPAKFSDRILTS